MKDKEIIIISEGVVASILKDIVTFGFIFALLWFNHSQLSGNGWLDFLFVLLALMMASIRNSAKIRRFTDKTEAISYIRDDLS